MAGIEEYSNEEFQNGFQGIVSALVADGNLAPLSSPRAVLLGGQSGAGKTTLHNIFLIAQKGNAIIINGDEYRSHHPRFREISARYGIDAPSYTAAWAGSMVEALVDALSTAGYNLIIEGTLRTSEVPLKTARLLRDRGYDVSLALMAVKPEISLVSCQLRYEQMRIAGTEPRAVDPNHHLLIVESIVSNLKVLEESGLFDTVSLYDRAERRLFFSEDDGGYACDALERILFGEWSDEERLHLAYLERKLAELKTLG